MPPASMRRSRSTRPVILLVSGAASIGINAQTQGDVTITSLGNITAGPDSSVAILALSQSGNVIVALRRYLDRRNDRHRHLCDERARQPRSSRTAASPRMGTTRPELRPRVIPARRSSRPASPTLGDDSAGITAYGAGAVAGTAPRQASRRRALGPTASTSSARNGTANRRRPGDISATGAGSAAIYAAGYAGTVVMNTGNADRRVLRLLGRRRIHASVRRRQPLLNWGSMAPSGWRLCHRQRRRQQHGREFRHVTGDVSLFDGPSFFTNHAGALFNSGAVVQADFLINDGTIAPGGAGRRADDVLDRRFGANAERYLCGRHQRCDIRPDRRVGHGRSSPARLRSTSSACRRVAVPSFTILTAASGVTNNGLGVSASPALHATLLFSNPNTVQLGIAVDFMRRRSQSQRDVARPTISMRRSLLVAAVSRPRSMGLLNTVGPEDYKAAHR